MDKEQLLQSNFVVIPMNATRQVSKSSVLLNINRSDFTKYQKFDPSKFIVPKKGWLPPYPYCLDDILIPVEYQLVDKDNEGILI